MSRFLIAGLVLFLTHSVDAQTNAIVSGVRILSETKLGDGASIKASQSGEYGGGIILGRPIKASKSGYFFKTYNLQIRVGEQVGVGSDSSLYIGTTFSFSTDSEKVFDYFQTLDHKKNYIFTYKHINPLNPEIEDSHFQVTSIETAEEYLKRKGISSLPIEIKSGDAHHGQYSDGVRHGRIVDVERYGFFGNFCYFQLRTSAELLSLTILDEALCDYVENAIALGQDMEISYTVDYWEVWQQSKFFCKGIRCIPKVEVHTTSSGEPVKRLETPLSPGELDKIKSAILSDPKFIDDLVKALGSRNK